MQELKSLLVRSEALTRQAYRSKRIPLMDNQFHKRFGLMDVLITKDLQHGNTHITQAGSDEFNDWIKNLCFFSKRAGDSKVHGAYIDEIDTHLEDLIEYVFDHHEKGTRLVFDGHSRGGGMSSLLALRLFQGKLLPTIKPKIITFGAPKPFKRLDHRHAWIREATINVINKADFVTKVPFGWKPVGTDIVRNIDRLGEDHTIYKDIVQAI